MGFRTKGPVGPFEVLVGSVARARTFVHGMTVGTHSQNLGRIQKVEYPKLDSNTPYMV